MAQRLQLAWHRYGVGLQHRRRFLHRALHQTQRAALGVVAECYLEPVAGHRGNAALQQQRLLAVADARLQSTPDVQPQMETTAAGVQPTGDGLLAPVRRGGVDDGEKREVVQLGPGVAGRYREPGAAVGLLLLAWVQAVERGHGMALQLDARALRIAVAMDHAHQLGAVRQVVLAGNLERHFFFGRHTQAVGIAGDFEHLSSPCLYEWVSQPAPGRSGLASGA